MSNNLDHKHTWKDSRQVVGLVGDLYWRMYPWACECGALMKADRTIPEPTKKGDQMISASIGEKLIKWGGSHYFQHGDVVPINPNDYTYNSLRKTLELPIPATFKEEKELENHIQEALEFLKLHKWKIIKSI